MSSYSHLIVFVYTGNKKNAGTNGNVQIILYGDHGQVSKAISLDNLLLDDFERDQVDTFRLSLSDVENLERSVSIRRLELWKGRTLGIFSDEWYVDKIVVQNTATNQSFEFPLFRWIKPGYHYNFKHLDTSLPQFDPFPEQRKKELHERKQSYEFVQQVPDGPAQVKSVPPDEQFSFEYKWDIVKSKMVMKFVSAISSSKKWNDISDIEAIYIPDVYGRPAVVDRWSDDIQFARQRLAGVNPTLISLLRTVPDKFPITDELLEPLLDGLTIEKAIAKKRLYFCDLKILEGIPTEPAKEVSYYELCKPIALFFVDKTNQLRPVAIQLFQKPGPTNPIFTPLDEPTLWKYVKMWYNHADSAHHQSLTHLGLTHLLMEGISIASNRNLSPSHPVYKILAPHFLYIIAINSRGLKLLISDGGWVDRTMSIGKKGMFALIVKGLNDWRMNVDGLLPNDLKERGVDDPSKLPGYHYADDATLIFKALKKYVASYVNLYYKSPQMVKDDDEIQAWAQELVMERQKSGGGVGLKGVPGNGSIETLEDLVDIIVSIIFTCSVAHASANFGQYEEYAYPLNYPTLLNGEPPRSKNAKITDQDIVDSLPDFDIMQDILQVSTVLSRKATNSLGDFEVQYIFDPRAKALVDNFRKELKVISKTLVDRNGALEIPYEHLLPERIPNSISI